MCWLLFPGTVQDLKIIPSYNSYNKWRRLLNLSCQTLNVTGFMMKSWSGKRDTRGNCSGPLSQPLRVLSPIISCHHLCGWCLVDSAHLIPAVLPRRRRSGCALLACGGWSVCPGPFQPPRDSSAFACVCVGIPEAPGRLCRWTDGLGGKCGQFLDGYVDAGGMVCSLWIKG